MANMLNTLGRYAEALFTSEECIQEFPNNSGYAYCIKGMALYNLTRYDEALDAYNKAFSLGFETAPHYVTLGNIHCKLGSYQNALDAYEQAICLDSKLSDAYEGKGTVLKLLAEKAFAKVSKKEDPFEALSDSPF
jgi:tetratricopeptide (TPR) repeat protein